MSSCEETMNVHVCFCRMSGHPRVMQVNLQMGHAGHAGDTVSQIELQHRANPRQLHSNFEDQPSATPFALRLRNNKTPTYGRANPRQCPFALIKWLTQSVNDPSSCQFSRRPPKSAAVGLRSLQFVLVARVGPLQTIRCAFGALLGKV